MKLKEQIREIKNICLIFEKKLYKDAISRINKNEEIISEVELYEKYSKMCDEFREIIKFQIIQAKNSYNDIKRYLECSKRIYKEGKTKDTRKCVKVIFHYEYRSYIKNIKNLKSASGKRDILVDFTQKINEIILRMKDDIFIDLF